MNPAGETVTPAHGKVRVLIFAEAVTLAHVARPHALAAALDPAQFHVCLAKDTRYDLLLGPQPYDRRDLGTIPSQRFLQALAQGRPLYREADLERYVEEDLDLIQSFDPHLVVGDFRLSLSVSARLAGRPYMTISNAYWSPHAHPRYRVPDLPMLTWLGHSLGQAVFDAVRPVAFALHSRPLNRVRRRHGLPGLGHDLRRTYTDADWVLYADLPELVPTRGLPASHQYLGPLLWEPALTPPSWWGQLPDTPPLVFITLGSSGPAAHLQTLVDALAPLPITLVVATAGRTALRPSGANVLVADYLPARQVIARARLVICNGGSPVSYLALCAGRPVLGLPANLDQLLNMDYVRRYGAGEFLRTGRWSADRLRTLVMAMLDPQSTWAHAASRLRAACAHYDAATRFASALRQAARA